MHVCDNCERKYTDAQIKPLSPSEQAQCAQYGATGRWR